VKLNPLTGEAPKSEFTSIRSLDIFSETIAFEPINESAFMKTGLFEENKKSEEFKESSQKLKTSNASGTKVLNYMEDFIKEAKANFKKNAIYINQTQLNQENTEKAKVGNKKKLLKIMAFRFIKNSKEETHNKEQYDRYENDHSSPADSYSLFSNPKKFENNSNMNTNKKYGKKNEDFNQKQNTDNTESYKNKNNHQTGKNNSNRDKENLIVQKANKPKVGIIDVEVEKFFNDNENELNELTNQDKISNNKKNFQADLNDAKSFKKHINPNQIGYNNSHINNNYNQNQQSQINLDNYNYQYQNNTTNNYSNVPNSNSNFRNKNLNSNTNSNYQHNTYNKAYGGYNYNNPYGLSNYQQNNFEGNYNNNNRSFNYNQAPAQQFDQGFNNFESRNINKGSYVNNATSNNNQNYDDRYGNKTTKIYKGKKY